MAAAISEAAGRSVRYRSISEDEMRSAVVAAGLGLALAERQVRFYRLVRAGSCAPVSDAVETVLGRPPISFARFALDHAADWR